MQTVSGHAKVPRRWRSLRRWGVAAAITVGGAGGVTGGALLAGAFAGAGPSPAATHLLLTRDAAAPKATAPSGHASVRTTVSSSGGSLHASGSGGGLSASGGGGVHVKTPPTSLAPPSGFTPPSLAPPSGFTPPSLTLPLATPPANQCVASPGIPGAGTSPVMVTGHLKVTTPGGGGSGSESGTGLKLCFG